MSKRRRRWSPASLSAPDPARNPAVINAALGSLDADGLRDLVRAVLVELEGRAYRRVVNELIDRAARSDSAWTPDAPTDEQVAEAIFFAEAARRDRFAAPVDVDARLRLASNAFIARRYTEALKIFLALLIPATVADIDLCQEELIQDELGVDVATCAAQYLVSVYMTSAPAERARKVRAASGVVRDISRFDMPLREMDRVAVEPLPGRADFLEAWRALPLDS